jgi:GWxTD domain-containing protein
MLLADSSRWRELESFSQTHIKAIPWDPQAWLALGLALQREGKSKDASAAFDSGMTNMTPQERSRLDRLERVLRPMDTARVARGGAGDHAALEKMYWLFADPLWSREGNESRIEFLARVEFAELRWTVEELNVHGADTDRGDKYIRYGPPDMIAAIAPGVNGDFTDIVTYWLYKSGLMFSFSGMSTFGTARTPQQDEKMVGGILNAQPIRWDNIAELKVDTIPVQVARFRGGNDSVDVLVAARPNSSAIAQASDVNERVRDWYWLLQGGTVPVYFDSTKMDTAGVRTWTRRVSPGAYAYRIEASAHSASRAARSTAQVTANTDPRTGFALHGFSISDVLVASHVDAPTSSSARWTSLNPVAVAGSVPRGTQLSLVWENYDFGQRDNSAAYSVVLTIVKDRSGAGKIAARIVGLLADIAQVTTQNDRVVLKFDRAQPYSAAFADQIDLALGDTPVGVYSLTLEVTDKATGRKSTRTTSFSIKEK